MGFLNLKYKYKQLNIIYRINNEVDEYWMLINNSANDKSRH